MPKRHEPKPDDYHNVAKTILDHVADVGRDPLIEDTLTVVGRIQTSIDTMPDATVHDADELLMPVNVAWSEEQRPGVALTYTGKLRINPRVYMEADAVALFPVLKDYAAYEDDYGKYFLVNDFPLVCSWFEVMVHEDDEENERYTYALTFADDDNLDEESGLPDTSFFMAYPTDIKSIDFSTPSNQHAEKQLQYFFPNLYAMLLQQLEHANGSDKSRLKALQSLRISLEGVNAHGMNLAKLVEQYVQSKITFDNDLYELYVNGSIKGVKESRKLTEATVQADTPLSGYVSGLIVTGSDTQPEILQPKLVVARLASDMNAEYYEGILVPVESIVKMRSLRRRNRYFGKTAMFPFESPIEVYDHFKRYQEKKSPPSRDLPKEHQLDKDTFDAVTADMVHENHRPFIYNEERGCYEVRVDDDLTLLFADYNEHIDAMKAFDPHLEPTALDYMTIVSALLRYTIPKFEHLQLGDAVAINQDAIVRNENNIQDEIITLKDGLRVQGEFGGITITTFPSGNTPPQYKLAMLLHDPFIFDEEGEHMRNLAAKPCTVAVLIHEDMIPHIVKIQYGESLGLEGE
ncbi:MAG: hypothetical protein WAQ25_01835 [Candidatus Saccharimonas sp.]